MTKWGGSFRWFGAELAVVVAGVLIAFGVQAKWQLSNDRIRERSYLRQISRDMQVTDSLIRDSDTVMAAPHRAAANLLRAYRISTPVSTDSLALWYQAFYTIKNPTPITATAEALVSSGDLRLIRDERLRSAIVAYIGESRRRIADQDKFFDMVADAGPRVFKHVDMLENALFGVPVSLIDSMARNDVNSPFPPGPMRTPFPGDLHETLRNRDVYDALENIYVAFVNLAQARTDMRKAAMQLKTMADSAR